MPTERLAWLFAAVAAAMLILLGPAFPLPEGSDKAAHFVAFSVLTLTLWRASGGEMPLFVLGAVIALAGLDEWRQAYVPGRVSDATDFLADVAAAFTTAGLLLMQRKASCVESSPR